MHLKDKVVVITGASRGIGRATALEFSHHGCRVAVAARAVDELQSLAKEMEDGGATGTIAVKTDVSRKTDVDTLVERAHQKFGRIDILVNNAGMGIWGEVADITEKDFDTMVDVNFRGVFLATKAVLPLMMKQKSGHIVTISSVAGKRPIPKMAVYCGTKFALDGFCKTLAREVKPHNIRVSMVYPGMVDTHFRDEMATRPPYSTQERERMLTAEDVARGIVFMANQSPTSVVDELEINAPLF